MSRLLFSRDHFPAAFDAKPSRPAPFIGFQTSARPACSVSFSCPLTHTRTRTRTRTISLCLSLGSLPFFFSCLFDSNSKHHSKSPVSHSLSLIPHRAAPHRTTRAVFFVLGRSHARKKKCRFFFPRVWDWGERENDGEGVRVGVHVCVGVCVHEVR